MKPAMPKEMTPIIPVYNEILVLNCRCSLVSEWKLALCIGPVVQAPIKIPERLIPTTPMMMNNLSNSPTSFHVR